MSKIVFVGEAWGESEARLQRPLVGPSGITLLEMLHAAQIIALSSIDRALISEYWKSGYDVSSRNPHFVAEIWDNHSELLLTNTFNLRPPGGNDISNLCGPRADGIPGRPSLGSGKYVRAEYAPELDRLYAELAAAHPNVVVALGATPTWALLGAGSITGTRGTTAIAKHGPPVKVLPTFHPAAVMRDWNLRPIVIADLFKAKREAEFPEVRRPQRFIHIEPSLFDLADFHGRYIQPSRQLSIDIETASDMITCVGFAPSIDRALVVPFVKNGKSYWESDEEEVRAWEFVRMVCGERKEIVFQNGLYDMHFLWRTMGITVPHATHDTMLLHHALQPELKKGLGFLGTIYTDEASWKLMRKGSTTVKRED